MSSPLSGEPVSFPHGRCLCENHNLHYSPKCISMSHSLLSLCGRFPSVQLVESRQLLPVHKQWRRRQRGRCLVKKNLYFTFECRNCVNLFSTLFGLKPCSGWTCTVINSVQFQKLSIAVRVLQVVRDLTQNTTATAARTSTNKSLNEQNNSCARAL